MYAQFRNDVTELRRFLGTGKRQRRLRDICSARGPKTVISCRSSCDCSQLWLTQYSLNAFSLFQNVIYLLIERI